VHCADLSASTRPLEIAITWSKRILEEFFNQGDRESALGLEIGPLNDRHKTSVPGSQVFAAYAASTTCCYYFCYLRRIEQLSSLTAAAATAACYYCYLLVVSTVVLLFSLHTGQ